MYPHSTSNELLLSIYGKFCFFRLSSPEAETPKFNFNWFSRKIHLPHTAINNPAEYTATMMLSHLLWQRHVARQTPTTAVLRCPNFYHKCRLHDPNSFFGKQAGALNLHPPPMSSFAKSSPHKYLLSVSHANRQGRGDDYTAVDGRRDGWNDEILLIANEGRSWE